MSLGLREIPRFPGRWDRALPDAAAVDKEAAKVGRVDGHLLVPERVVEAVAHEEHEGRSAPHVLVVEPYSVGDDERHRRLV